MTSVYRAQGTHAHYASNIIGALPPVSGATENALFAIVKHFTNNQGSNLVMGDSVKIDTSGNNRIIKTTTLGDLGVIGVVCQDGPFANGDATPVLMFGYHPKIKATGTIARGDYLQCSNTDGTVEVMAIAGAGIFGRATGASSGGFVAGIIFDPSLGAGAGGAATQLHETGGPTDLTIAAVPDGYYLKRVGSTVVGGVPVGGVQYDPRLAPASPSSLNDEFDDLSLAAKWATGSSGGGSTGVVNETDRKGFVHTNVNDGGAGSARWIDQALSPAVAAGNWTMMARVFGNVGGAGSNQMNLELSGSGTTRFVVGMLNGTQAIINGPGGFTAHNRTYITGNFGEIWLMIQHDSGTGMDGWVSGDGMIWTRLTGMTSAGTVDNIRLVAVAFSSSNAEGWWDFFRYFPGVRTFDVGGTP